MTGLASPAKRQDPAQGLSDLPQDLREALAALNAEVVRVSDHRPRVHLRLRSSAGPLFTWYSQDPADRAVLDHELAVRRILGTEGPLRGPPVLSAGENWRVERLIETDPPTGSEAIDQMVEAVRALVGLDLPPPPRKAGSRRLVASAARRARLAASRLPLRDVIQARRLATAVSLPRVTSHGDFHLAHVLLARGAAWVIDWELSRPRPLGLDLMQMWVSLPLPEDRSLLMDRSLDLVGAGFRRELLRLRYFSLVQRIGSKLAEQRRYGDRNVREAQALLELLPGVRAEALTVD